jgi:YesN/AraC family two-component response regulator
VKLVGGHINQNSIKRVNGYPDYQWLHCTKGKGKLLIDGKEFILEKNSGFYMSPNTPHEYFALEEPWETHWVAFSGYDAENLLKTLDFKQYEIFTFVDIKFLDNILTDIFDIVNSNSRASGLRSSAKLYTLLMELKNSVRDNLSSNEKVQSNKLDPVFDYIENNYNKNPSIEEMAIIINASPQYLCRIFKQSLNMRPFTYITKYRLQKSKELLLTSTDMKVEVIALAVGYNDPSYFCSIFKKHEGVTPIEFRSLNS